MEKKVNIKFSILAISLILIFCFAITPVTLQNDTFYTIKIGEYITQNGITMLDPFSWHEGLKYTYPHWAYDVMISFIYNLGGQTGIYVSTIILTCMLGLALYLTNSKITKNKVTSFILTIGVLYCMQDYIAARAQLVTFILFVLTIYFIEMFLQNKKRRYALGLIIIPIVIANFHLAVFPFYFVLYLPYIGEYIINLLSNTNTIINKRKINKLHKKILKINNEEEIEKIKNKIIEMENKNEKAITKQEKVRKDPYKVIIEKNNNVKYLIIIMIICLFTGLLTPLGDTPYTYLYNTMRGTTTQNINEHLPLTLINNPNFICVLILFIAILMFTDTKIKLRDAFMLGGLIVLAFYTKRQFSMLLIICVLIFNKLLCAMFQKYYSEGLNRIQKSMTTWLGILTTICLVLTISVFVYKPKMDDTYIDENSYPVQASEYILQNIDLENAKFYNEYNYGSYLLFKDIPVFIDSRADLYSPEFNEGVNVFTDFLNISGLNITNIDNKLDEYGITHLIMHSNAKLRIFVRENEEEYIELYDDGKFCIYERVLK